MSEVEQVLDLSVLRYSRVDEDYRVLSKALQICPKDIILSITSAGDNVLNLLLESPKKIVAVDMSSAQNSLLELKIAAISHLQYEEYLILLGETMGNDMSRKTVYDKVKEFLPQYARVFWDSNVHFLMNGLSGCGRLQQFVNKHCVIPISKAVSSAALDEFFNAENLTEQRNCFEAFPLQKIKSILRDQVANLVSGRSAAQVQYVTLSIDERVELLWERFCSVSCNVPSKDNFYLSLYLRGKRSGALPTPVQLLPPFLTQDGFCRLKGLVDRIEIHTSSIENYLLSSTTQFHKMNLSDIFEYISPESCDILFTRLCGRIVPGGLLAYWNFYRDCQNPESNCRATLQVDFSKELQKIDRVFFFKFHLLQIS